MLLVLKGKSKERMDGLYLEYISDLTVYPEYHNNYLPTLLSPSLFLSIISPINDILISYWPCTLTRVLQYTCIACTLGASLMIDRCLMADCKQALQIMIKQINHHTLYPLQLELVLNQNLVLQERELDEGVQLSQSLL